MTDPMDDECVHGLDPAWCGLCLGHDDPTTSRAGDRGLHGGRTKQDALDDLCRLIGLPPHSVGEGSSLPSEVFVAAAKHVGVSSAGSMPEVCERIAAKAGERWGPACDSRGSTSGGGSTVTLAGLEMLIRAIDQLS